MTTSLKGELLEAIKRSGHLDIKSVEAIAHMQNRKVDNATRRLRELMNSGVVEAVRDEKKVIIGYQYKAVEKIRPVEAVEQGALFGLRQRNY